MRTNRFDINRMTRSNTGGGGGSTGGGSSYTLPLADNGIRGGVQIGYTTSAANRNYAVQLDNEKMFVNVPWTDHHAWGDITDKPTTATRWPTWDEVSSKPSSFTPSAHTHAWGDITSGVPATATRWPTWSEVTSKPASKTAWGKTYLDSNSSFNSISGDLSAGSSGGTISQFHSIELNSAGSLSGYGGFIDFHFNGSQADYTSRIIEDASGKLNLNQSVFVNYNGNVGIGTDSPSYKLHVAGKIYCTGGFAFLSDIRRKNVIDRNFRIGTGDIAKAPLIRYTLKDDDQKDIHIGSVAQYWQNIIPEAVTKAKDGTLSMDYSTISLISAVILARKVETLEKELSALKKLIS